MVNLFPNQLTLVGNHTLLFRGGGARSANACLMLHGFPAATPPSPQVEKNQDIAARIANSLRMDVYLNHYRGLGKSEGRFSFRRSIEDSLKLAQLLLDKHKYRSLNILGHSWGGFVAMNVAHRLNAFGGKMILLSPLNLIPPEPVLKQVLATVCEGVSIDFESGGIDGAVSELLSIAEDSNPRTIAPALNWTTGPITIIQALNDDEVSVESTRKFVNLFPHGVKYIEFDSDHKFSINREHLINLIIARLKA